MENRSHALPPDRSAVVLLILDMISDFRFPDGAEVARAARRIAPRIRKLRERATAAGIATIYVNDNPGRWRSDLTELMQHCTGSKARGRDIVELLAPRAADYFVLKPRHSAFYATPLEVLLNHLSARCLIVTGVSSHQCVLFTANDAHVRNYEIIVPSDCIGSPGAGQTRFALKYFDSVLGARVARAAALRLPALAKRKR
jgi:nicotinamidase-related amidase